MADNIEGGRLAAVRLNETARLGALGSHWRRSGPLSLQVLSSGGGTLPVRKFSALKQNNHHMITIIEYNSARKLTLEPHDTLTLYFEIA